VQRRVGEGLVQERRHVLLQVVERGRGEVRVCRRRTISLV
jgi:hypothetical protein